MRTRLPTYLSTGVGDFFFYSRKHKEAPVLSLAGRRPKKTFSLNAPVAIGHGDRGLAPHRRLWSVAAAEAKGRPGAEPSAPVPALII
jgi:hypothetical protein